MNGARDPIVPMEAFNSGYQPLVRDVVARVAFETGLKPHQIVGVTREQPFVRARMAICWFARAVLKRERALIGKILGRTAWSIDYNCRQAEILRERDPAFRMLTDKLLAEFSGEM